MVVLRIRSLDRVTGIYEVPRVGPFTELSRDKGLLGCKGFEEVENQLDGRYSGT